MQSPLAIAGRRISLRTRLFLGMLAVTVTATAGFAIAMHEFVEVLEDELLNETLSRELDSLVLDYQTDSSIAGKRGHSGRVYVVAPGRRESALPKALQRLPPLENREIHIDGREYFAARRDVADARIYLALDVESIEALESRLVTIGWLTLAGAIAVSLVLSIVFSYLILRPVRSLSTQLAAVEPGMPVRPIASDYSDREMRSIADSFDTLIERFHRFIERERSFTEDASHELRTPLAIALSTQELLLKQSDLSAQVRERVTRAQTACVRMERLVSALLFLARDERSSGAEHCDMADIIADMRETYQAQAEHKGVELLVDTRPTPIAASAGIADCVLHNLLENAVMHTSRGTITVSLDGHTLCVTDTGEGIEHTAIEHIFDRRYRSAASRGFGIGLYLVQRICVRLGWTISVTSHADRGTQFRIAFNENSAVRQ